MLQVPGSNTHTWSWQGSQCLQLKALHACSSSQVVLAHRCRCWRRNRRSSPARLLQMQLLQLVLLIMPCLWMQLLLPTTLHTWRQQVLLQMKRPRQLLLLQQMQHLWLQLMLLHL
jgi:hypothetical protein